MTKIKGISLIQWWPVLWWEKLKAWKPITIRRLLTCSHFTWLSSFSFSAQSFTICHGHLALTATFLVSNPACSDYNGLQLPFIHGALAIMLLYPLTCSCSSCSCAFCFSSSLVSSSFSAVSLSNRSVSLFVSSWASWSFFSACSHNVTFFYKPSQFSHVRCTACITHTFLYDAQTG